MTDRIPALRGRTALITGAGSGIGRALAVEASRRGMAVALVGRRTRNLDETRQMLPPGAVSLVIAADVTSAIDRQAIRERLAAEWGALGILVNNAGMLFAGAVTETDDDRLTQLIATNFAAPFAMTRELLPLLCASPAPRLVNIGSMLGDIAMPFFAAYSASKFALRGLSDALRRELRGLGVGVTYAAPRGARTDAARALARYLEPLGMPLDPPEAIAARIWNAVARGADTVYPPGRERVFVLLERLAPSLVTRALKARFERAGIAGIAAASLAAGHDGASQTRHPTGASP